MQDGAAFSYSPHIRSGRPPNIEKIRIGPARLRAPHGTVPAQHDATMAHGPDRFAVRAPDSSQRNRRSTGHAKPSPAVVARDGSFFPDRPPVFGRTAPQPIDVRRRVCRDGMPPTSIPAEHSGVRVVAARDAREAHEEQEAESKSPCVAHAVNSTSALVGPCRRRWNRSSPFLRRTQSGCQRTQERRSRSRECSLHPHTSPFPFATTRSENS